MQKIDLSRVNTVVHLCASNDRNGNPRRIFVAFAGSALRGAWDEGYDGHRAVPEAIRHLSAVAPRINVAAKELSAWRSAAADLWPPFCNG